MPPRVSFWTGTWAPALEAHSQEVAALRAIAAPSSTVVAAATGQRTRLRPRERVYAVDASSIFLLRALALWLEPRADLGHLFGAADNWHLLRRLGRRPLLFTVTVPGVPPAPALLAKVTRFAAETESLAGLLLAHGADPERIEVVPPGVDLDRFAPAPPPPSSPFRVLFASSPPTPDLLVERGVPLLVELARLRSDLEVTLSWRAWGDVEGCLRALGALDPPPNVRVEVGVSPDMPVLHGRAHVVACCFGEGRAKAAPNSLIEGLACGRPALVTPACGLATMVEERGAGVVAEPRPEALAAAVDRLRGGWPGLAAAARSLAEERFGRDAFLARYASRYAELAAVARS